MRLLHESAIFQTVKSKLIISLFETVRLSVSISLRNLYNSLNSIKEKRFLCENETDNLTVSKSEISLLKKRGFHKIVDYFFDFMIKPNPA